MRYALFDIHSHLTFADFDADRDDIIARMKDDGIGTITVGTDAHTSADSVALAEKHEHLFATVGIHPSHETHGGVGELAGLAAHPKVVAIGECGLDYFRLDAAADTIKQEQSKLFEQHIALAHERSLPLMIHARPSKGSMDAYEDILALLKNNKYQISSSKEKNQNTIQGNVHFFAGTVAVARKFLDLGFSISFDGPITFATEYDEVIRFVPDDMIMAETDAPFAAPAPFRGKRNEPAYVRYVVEKIASLRGSTPDACARMLTENALRLFRIEGETVSF